MKDNETVEHVCEKMKEPSIYKGRFPASFFDGEFCAFADRILAAHNREVDELKHWIKSAARWIKCHDIYNTSADDLIKQAKEILNDDGEFLFKKGGQ